jgi:ribosomal protein L37AE/L43A
MKKNIECPNCGYEAEYDFKFHIYFCGNCKWTKDEPIVIKSKSAIKKILDILESDKK